jgi:hypothetical protein
LISLINVIALIRLIKRFAHTLYYPVDSIRYGARVCSMKKLRKSHVPEQESVDIRPKYITLQRLGAEYGISKGKAVRMLEDGRIQAVRVVDEGRSRGKVLVIAESVDRYLKSLERVEPSNKVKKDQLQEA